MKLDRTLLLLILSAFVQSVCGQEYFTQGATPNLHLTHKVAAKETWYSLSRIFNLTPKEIAGYNKSAIDKPLEVGQEIKVPLTKSNFTQNDSKTGGEALVPVYHIVQEKEWMYRISVNHNKVPIEKIEKWNSITRDQAKAGMKLIVGYLKVKDGNMAKNEGSENDATSQKQEPTVAETKPAAPATNPTSATNTNSSGGSGYFQSQYDGNGKNLSAISGIFKSTSGWSDGKYYALMNNVTVGTIVKVSFPQTNKSIYAKVLGELPDMKESSGLSLRISDAAARELGAVANKFSVDVMY
jgi:LysM repeat protein